jgi:CRISPR-associated protein Cas2
MFVAVACDFSNLDNKDTIIDLLLQYGFKKTITNLYESTAIDDDRLTRLKKDIDRNTDSYDRLRIFQYPMENTLVITSLNNKKWVKFKIVV